MLVLIFTNNLSEYVFPCSLQAHIFKHFKTILSRNIKCIQFSKNCQATSWQTKIQGEKTTYYKYIFLFRFTSSLCLYAMRWLSNCYCTRNRIWCFNFVTWHIISWWFVAQTFFFFEIVLKILPKLPQTLSSGLHSASASQVLRLPCFVTVSKRTSWALYCSFKFWEFLNTMNNFTNSRENYYVIIIF